MKAIKLSIGIIMIMSLGLILSSYIDKEGGRDYVLEDGIEAADMAQSPVCEAPEPVRINVQVANYFFKEYYRRDPLVIKDTVKALVIDKQQLAAMSQICEKNPEIVGFRVYYGLEADEKICMIVGYDEENVDDIKMILKSSRVEGSLCPDICDRSSPIIKLH